ncbi:hypothetical protein CEXT_235241 [Caerostris extrusa]|uniref:Uncharacterized protein n=1 Tax=Caerostris extrusa TaxID=172846 RepID=A0AAV4Y5X7_CAEEX|nr:hypothetical protein CEXT_235241 [Caerostris extrusa]
MTLCSVEKSKNLDKRNAQLQFETVITLFRFLSLSPLRAPSRDADEWPGIKAAPQLSRPGNDFRLNGLLGAKTRNWVSPYQTAFQPGHFMRVLRTRCWSAHLFRACLVGGIYV